MLILLIYVGLGVIADVVITLYYMALSERRAFRASVYALIIPLFSFLVIERALATKDIRCIVGFVIGNAIGTYLAVKRG